MTDGGDREVRERAALRRDLPGRRGRSYWTSLEQLAESSGFKQRLAQDFPAFAGAVAQAYDRRRFLQLAAASIALMGLASCGPEVEPRERRPYVEQPEGMVPGKARYYASATRFRGYGQGVLVEHQMGRPIKVEGNPDHPASLGATSAIGQASILGLYDPYRAQTLTHDGAITTWEAFAGEMIGRRAALQGKGGLAILTGTVTSPTLIAQIDSLGKQFPGLRWHQWEPVNRDSAYAGAQLAFGRSMDLLPDFAAAEIILAIDSDFLDFAPGHLRFARDFAARRRPTEVKEAMSRLYAWECTPTLAGAKADHCLPMSPREIAVALRILASLLGAGPSEWSGLPHRDRRAIEIIASDLKRAHAPLLHVGDTQPPEIHALAHAINHALGAFGKTLATIEPVAPGVDNQTGSLAELAHAMQAGDIDTLIVLGGDPIFTAPADLDFAAALKQVPFSVYLGDYADETASEVHWYLPQAHEYEAWSDIRAFDGTATIQQPQIQWLLERRSPHQLLALLAGDTSADGLAIVRNQWQSEAARLGFGDFDLFWTEALRSGVVRETAASALDPPPLRDFTGSLPAPPAAAADTITVLFRPDIGVFDGSYADNGWLQEMPRPFTRLTWDNAALIAPRTAQRLGLATGDLVAIGLAGRKVSAPVWILPGQSENCVTLPLGFGRRRCGPVAEGVGFDAYPLRPQDMPWQAAGAEIAKTGSGHVFAPIQHELRMNDRDLVHEGHLADFLTDPHFLQRPKPNLTLYPQWAYPGIAWAMSIDLNACIGCEACVVACQAENNGPIVGKEEIVRGRDMHWLRIDRYYSGPVETPQTVFQPVPCMHCENAPCEVVCPVHATVHDSEGLNAMVYNRCVGTRFCSNNCPYKVRRFNFFDFTAEDQRPSEAWNPDVTVRGRGVMEKCTYCLQRTREAMIDADRENRPVRDGEVKTACQQACPTQAITFGDRNDKSSAVAARKASPLDYVMLDDLNTRPRTSYEALIRNPNIDLEDV